MADDALALGVDVGTGSVRAFLYTSAGELYGSGARLPYEWRITTDGGVEVDPEALVQLVIAAIDGALLPLPHDAPPVVAVGISALWHTLLGVRRDGAAVTPAYAWSDTRSTRAARQLRTRLDEAAVHARTGAMLHPSYPLTRLAWLRDSDPAVFRQVDWWMSVPEYIWLRLTGQRAVDLSIAAGSGLLDQLTLEWDAELLEVAGVESPQLAPVARGDSVLLRPAPGTVAADNWKLLRGAVWRIPAGDGLCANIGSGCTSAESMALTVGTSAAARVLLPWPYGTVAPDGLWMYRLDPERAVLGGAISNGGLVRRWLRRTLRLPDDDAQLDARLAALPPAAHGISFVPFLAGERSPDWPLDATGTLAGLRLGTGPLHLLQAGLEAVAYRIALLRRLVVAAAGPSQVVASGAALERSAYWTQLVADVLGEQVLLSGEREASSRGAAMLALVAAGVIPDLDAVAAPAVTAFDPDMHNHGVHRAAMARQLELARANTPGET